MSLFADFEEPKPSKPAVQVDMTARVKDGAVTHDLLLWVPVRHGPFEGGGEGAEAPESPEGMATAQRIAAAPPRKVANEVHRTLKEGDKPMVGLKGRKEPGVG